MRVGLGDRSNGLVGMYVDGVFLSSIGSGTGTKSKVSIRGGRMMMDGWIGYGDGCIDEGGWMDGWMDGMNKGGFMGLPRLVRRRLNCI